MNMKAEETDQNVCDGSVFVVGHPHCQNMHVELCSSQAILDI